jgi:hypothetical protein
MADAGLRVSGLLKETRVILEVTRRRAAWEETVTGALTIEEAPVRREFAAVEVALVWNTPEAAYEYVDRPGRWHGLALPEGEGIRLPFALKVPWGVGLGGVVAVQAAFRPLAGRPAVMSCPLVVRPPEQFTRVMDVLTELTGLSVQAWEPGFEGRAAARLGPERGRPCGRPDGRQPLLHGEMEVEPAARPLVRLVRAMAGQRTYRVPFELPRTDPETVRGVLEERLRYFLTAARALPIPARPPASFAADLPRPASPPPAETESLPLPSSSPGEVNGEDDGAGGGAA